MQVFIRQFSSYYLPSITIEDDLFISTVENLNTLLYDMVSIMILDVLLQLGLQFLKINSEL